jgi:Cu2+-containing amine oxidase
MAKKKDGNWFKRHKILTGIIALVVLLAIIGAANDKTGTKQASNNGSSQQTSATVPKYDVVHRSTNERFDKAETLYVVIDPVDTSNDSFKASVKAIVKDIATKKNFKEFTVNVYDNADTAAWQYNMSTPSNQTEAKAKLAERAQHLIANYSGGIDLDTAKASTADKAYSISFYPGADKTTATVGKYVSTEQFKP